MSTLVVGAGISGLLAAWHLHRRGEAVEIWEAETQIGGWMQTLPWPTPDGREGHLERGPQGLLVSPDSPTDQLFKAIGLELKSPGKGARWVGKGQGLIPVPSHPLGLATSPLLSLGAKLRMALEPFQPVRPAEPEEGLYDFIARRAGKGMADQLLAPMVAGILAAPPKVLSVDAIPKLRQWESCGSLFNGVRKSGISHLMVPEGGMGTLPIRLAELLPPVRTGLRATSLEPCPAGWRVKGPGETREVARVVLAIPAFEAAAILAPVSPASAQALASIPYTSVKLWHSRHTPLAPYKDGFGFLIDPDFGRPYLGTLVPSWIDTGSAPPDLMQLRSFIGDSALWEDPEPDRPKDWAWTEAHLRRWLPKLGEALQTREEVSPNAIPRPVVGHRTWVDQALEALPLGLEWISNARFGVGARDVIEGIPEILGDC